MFVINETMDFSSIIFKRDNGFCAKRWYFFELIAKRFDAFIRHSRVGPSMAQDIEEALSYYFGLASFCQRTNKKPGLIELCSSTIY